MTESVPDRSARSLARDALVLAIDPATGKPWNGATFVVPGALLVELVREGRLSVQGTGKKAQVAVRDPSPLGNEELDDALQLIGSSVVGNKVTKLLRYVPQTPQLLDRLVAEGVVIEEAQRRLGLFTVRRYRLTPAADRERLVAAVRSALLGESVPDERTALLISVLVGVHLKLYVPKDRLKEAYRREEEILQRLGDDERAVVAAVKVALSNDDSGYSSSV